MENSEAQLGIETDRYFHELMREEQIRFVSDTRQAIEIERANRRSRKPRSILIISLAVALAIVMFRRAPLFLAAFAAIPLLVALPLFLYVQYLHYRMGIFEEFIKSSYTSQELVTIADEARARSSPLDILDALKASLAEAQRKKREKEHGS